MEDRNTSSKLIRMKRKLFFVSPLFLLVFLRPVYGQIRLPRLVKDSMILQRDAKINIWGWASPKEKVSVKFNNKSYKTAAGEDGKWILQLPPMKAGGPYTMNITASNKISLKDILIGDVWICAGQSNMVHQMKLHSVRYADDVANANFPEIRQFWVPNVTSLQHPEDDLPNGNLPAGQASWKSANPTDVLEFSAVAYFFARKIYEKYHVPIGLVNASWGGIPIESMMSEDALKEFPNILNTVQKNKDTAYINGLMRRGIVNPGNNRQRMEDKGLTGPKPWYDPAYIPKEWHTITVPGYWEDQGIKDLDGVVWYRREITVPASMIGIPARVFLGRIVDADVLYINGKQVGNTTYMYPQRRYNVPADLLKPGKNILVVKVTNNAGKGGFVPDKPYCLFTDKDTIDLKGNWQYKVGQVFIPQRGVGGGGINIQNQPTACYNAMIVPLINYSIKGFLWYQGESNTGRSEEYTKLQPSMIADWRNRWKQGDLPFLYVQLPNFMDANYLPSESQWAEFRDAQLRCLPVPNSAMAVTIDLGEWNDLHPDRKKDVGDRLALAALKLAYGENIVYSGPIYQSASVEGNKITISFSNVGGGLITNDGEGLTYFAIAGADKKFVWAKAKIDGDKVIVWNDDVPNPMYVRYAWADNPGGANLYNKEGLPASPFRTDK
jgi:sialate O-acetylesterase